MGFYVKVFIGLYILFLWIKFIYMYVLCFVFVLWKKIKLDGYIYVEGFDK